MKISKTAVSRYLMTYLLYAATTFKSTNAFIPADILNFVIDQSTNLGVIDIGLFGPSLSHEDIIERGIINSVATYFVSKNMATSNVTMSRLGVYYDDIKSLYYDHYGKWLCSLTIESLIKIVFKPNVALVDIDPSTKLLASAHFDAESFTESNQRVINFISLIYTALSEGKYTVARALAAQISHTIQDFYSHSNWLEMGNVQAINSAIGTTGFASQAIATVADNITCVSNCTLIQSSCSLFLQGLSSFLMLINVRSSLLSCPTTYYKCSGNLAVLDKLVTGYYTGESAPYIKPANGFKCSHGGILDTDSYSTQALGGINKDAGYYLLSPRADLHLMAAALAINHTAYFFNQIRANIGDSQYEVFMGISVSQQVLNNTNTTYGRCSAEKTSAAGISLMIILNVPTILYFYFV
jgi:hypothetical protein